MAETWSKLTPLDSAAASEGPARIRFIKTYMATLLAVEHTFTTGALTLTHNLTYAATEPAAGNENRWFYDSATSQIKRDTGTAWEAITPPKGLFPAGTKTAFCQATAPTGWTKDATYNDKMLRVVNTAGGGSSGSWSFTTDAASHNHTVVQPMSGGSPVSPYSNHVHTGPTSNPTNMAPLAGSPFVYGSIVQYGPAGVHIHTLTAYSHSHTSDGTFRPQYVDVIICTKS